MTRTGLLLLLATVTAGCQQKMADQPSYRRSEPSGFFPDGRSARPFPDGTVARQWVRPSDALNTGLRAGARGGPLPAGRQGPNDDPVPPADAPTDQARFTGSFPFTLTRADLDRGQERFTIYCAVCHDPVGTGHGKIPERGYVKPPNYHEDPSRGFALYGKAVPLRTVPVGYLFEVVTRGYGAMPRLESRIPVRDRWRIVAYVRALQVSQHAELATLPAGQRRAAETALGGGQ